MPDFTTNGGFLADDFSTLILENRRMNAPYFKLAEAINFAACELLDKADEAGHQLGAAAKTDQNQLAFLTLLRGVETYQALVILAERGMVNQVSVLTRALLETELKFAIAARSPADAEQLFTNELFHRRKQAEALAAAPSTSPSDKAAFAADIAQLNADLAGKQEKSNIFNMAQSLGQQHLYGVVYRYGSDAVHSNVGSLRQHVQRGDRGLFPQAWIGPLFHEVPFFLNIGMCVHLELIRRASGFFKIDYKAKIDHLEGARSQLPPPSRLPRG